MHKTLYFGFTRNAPCVISNKFSYCIFGMLVRKKNFRTLALRRVPVVFLPNLHTFLTRLVITSVQTNALVRIKKQIPAILIANSFVFLAQRALAVVPREVKTACFVLDG